MYQAIDSDAALAPPSLQLVEEISHRVLNEYTEAILTLSAAAQRSSDKGSRDTLAWAAHRLQAHAEAHRALLPPMTGASTNLADYVGQVCAALYEAALSDNQVRIALQVDDVWLEPERCWRIGLIVAELVRNAARHGLRRSAGSISVRIKSGPSGVNCLVCDNGRAEGQAEPGRGQRLVRGLAQEIGGYVDWWFTPLGCLARLRVPAPPTTPP